MRSRLARIIAILNEHAFIPQLQDGIVTPVIHLESPRRPAARLPAGSGTGALPVMQPSRFDLLTSFLLAVLVLVASWVLALLMIWMLAGTEPELPDRQPPLLLASAAAPAGEQADFEVPAAAEVTDLAAPTLANLVADIETFSQNVVQEDGVESTLATASADNRSAGPSEEGRDRVGVRLRWELTFRASGRQDYARQLDFHGIELAAFGGVRPGLDYASQLTVGPWARHAANPRGEQRLYFSWVRPSPLATYERQLLERAGIVSGGRQIVKFIPPELEIRLADLELEYAQSFGVSTPQLIARTVFRSEPMRTGYRFIVASQRYKRGSSVVSGGAKN